jgi:hypothetical protein
MVAPLHPEHRMMGSVTQAILAIQIPAIVGQKHHMVEHLTSCPEPRHVQSSVGPTDVGIQPLEGQAYSPSPIGRGRGEGHIGPERTLTLHTVPYADPETAIG